MMRKMSDLQEICEMHPHSGEAVQSIIVNEDKGLGDEAAELKIEQLILGHSKGQSLVFP